MACRRMAGRRSIAPPDRMAAVVTLGYLAVQIRLKHREPRQKEKQCAAQSLETEERFAIENS